MAGATNTIIQILRSSANSLPTTLNPGEEAYSYVSQKLFVGNTDNTVITIGGKYYVDLLDNATSANTGNTIVRRDTAGNVAFKMVSVADDASQLTDVINKNYLDSRINALSSNTIYAGNVGVSGYSNVHTSNTVGGGQVIIVANNTTVATFTKTETSFVQNVIVSGNLTVKGATSYTNVETLLVDNNEIVMNANASGSPLIDAFITVNRGAADNAAIIWNEATDKWQLDKAVGTNYDIVDTGGGQSIGGTTIFNVATINTQLNAGSANVIGLLDAGSARIDTIIANTSLVSGTITANTQLNAGSANVIGILDAGSARIATIIANTSLVSGTITANTQLNAASANIVGLLDAGSARIAIVVANTSLLSGTITANTALNAGSANIVNLLTAASINVTTLNATTGNLASIFINNTEILSNTVALPVSFGGTGLQTVGANTMLFGNGTGALGVTNSPTAGQVLQYRTDGVKFGGLDGGTF